MLVRGVLKRLPRFVRCRHKFSWDHNSYLTDDPAEVIKQSVEYKPWAQTPNARIVAGLASKIPSEQIDSGDILEYVHGRVDKEQQILSCPITIRSLAGLLSYPLTMAYALSLLFPSHYGRESVNILIVGARAESSLPLVWWRELLFTNHSTLQHNVRFVGPGLLQNRDILGTTSCEIKISDRHKLHKEHLTRSLTITNNFGVSSGRQMHKDHSVLHEHPDRDELLRWADVFFLYNPGYGNDNLRKSWQPTLQMLLHTRKPIVCTAYGQHDRLRDLNALYALTTECDDQELGEPVDFLIPPHENPYKSLKSTLDEREVGDKGIVVTNHSLYAVQAK